MKLKTQILTISLNRKAKSDEECEALLEYVDEALEHAVNYLKPKLRNIDRDLTVEMKD